MIMPGRNEIHYCPAALAKIIEKHINSEALVGNVTVTDLTVKHDGSVFTLIAHITSDKPKEST